MGLDFSGMPQFRDEASFRSALISHLLSAFGSVGFTYDATSRISFFDQFRIWLAELPLNSVVLIIDEYDAPLTALLGNDEAFSTAKDILCEFYARLKEGEGALRFLLMTGMTRFHQASVFPTLNNLTDISLDPHFGTLMGFTEEELVQYFAPHLRAAAETLGVSGTNALIDKMAEMYGGFCFDRYARTQVFHPGSAFRFLNAPELGFVNYWSESEKGPACLKHACSSGLLDASEASPGPFYADFSELALPADGRYVNSKSLLLQADCLTIKRAEGEVVELGCPNREVAESIGRKVLPA